METVISYATSMIDKNFDEQKAILRCQKENLDEFANLYDKYARKIYDFVYYKTFHKETAEDLTSKTFMKALEHINKFDAKKGKFSSWLYQIARNNIIDHYRSKKEEYNLAEFWGIASKDDTQKDLTKKETLAEVKEYLTKLTQEQKDIIVMRVWDDLSYQEIAQIIGKSEANCRMIFSRVIKQMRQDFIPLILALLLIRLV